MRTLLPILLLPLFAVLSGIVSLSRDHASPSNPSPSVSIAAVRDVSNEPSRVSTTTPDEKPAASSQSAAAAAEAPPAVRAAVASPPAPTPAPVASVSDDFTSQVEVEVLRLTSEERAKEGLSALASDSKLHEVAKGHSADMLANDYFNHENLQGCSSSCRATDAGYRWKSIGENIYMMSGYKLAPEKAAAMVVNGWMDSPGHRKNILGDSFTESGVGVVYDGKSIYVTALYAKPR